MKLKSEDRVKILEYKFIFEEEKQVHEEYQEGTADLNYRLSFFRDKLNNTSATNEQKERYNEMFMVRLPSEEDVASSLSQLDNEEATQSALKTSSLVKPWAKKVYRQITMVTHPDKTTGIQSKHLRSQLTEQYRITQNAYNKEIYSDLIMVAFDLNISLPENVVKEEIEPSSHKKKKEIQSIKQLMGWQWYHVPEQQKDDELKKILMHYGFEFTEQEVVEVVKRKFANRKVGTRPEKMFVKRKRTK